MVTLRLAFLQPEEPQARQALFLYFIQTSVVSLASSRARWKKVECDYEMNPPPEVRLLPSESGFFVILRLKPRGNINYSFKYGHKIDFATILSHLDSALSDRS